MSGIDSYTKLMLHLDGADDGTVFTDDSNSSHTVTTHNAVTKTGTKKFGTASGYFDGTGDYLTVPDSDDWCFGTENFTIDFWIRFSSLPSSQYYGIMGQRYNWDNNNAFSLVYTDTAGDILNIGFNNQSVAKSITWLPTVGTWYHVAYTRSGTTLYIFIDGDNKDTLDVTGLDVVNSNQPVAIGTLYAGGSSSYPFPGYMDEVRISKGIARWTTNFTPPTSAYSADGSYNISKFMGVDFANISKVFGIEVSNLDKFIGVEL